VDVVWLSDTPWRALDRRRKRMVAALQPVARVLYVEPPASMRLPCQSIQKVDGLTVAQVAPLLNTRQPWAKTALGLDWFRSVAERAANYQVGRILRASGWDTSERPRITIVSSVFVHRAAQALHPDRLIMEINLDPRGVDGTPPWTSELLWCSVAEADLVMTPSAKLARELRLAGIQHVQVVPAEDNDVEHGRTSRGRVTDHMVGYPASVGLWFDLPLVEQLARRCPELRIAVVGSADPCVADRFSTLARQANVVVLPATPLARASSDLQLSAVIVPVRDGEPHAREWEDLVTEETPVISTVAPNRADLRHRVDVCPSSESFVQMVRLRAARRTTELPLWDFASSTFRRRVLEGLHRAPRRTGHAERARTFTN
jgi:hypothetical protein